MKPFRIVSLAALVFPGAITAQAPDNDLARSTWFGGSGGDGAGQQLFAELGKRHLPRNWDGTSALALGDVDGDGDDDLVCGNAGQNLLYLNDGKGFFTDVTTARMPQDSDATSALALADVDGDGDADLVCGNFYQNSLYLNDGKGFFTDGTAARMPVDSDSTDALALGDVDGDGDADLVCGNFNQNRLYLNDGRGFFTDATATRMPVGSAGASALALGDVDRDGDLDLVCGNGQLYPQGQQNRLYLNDGRGFFTDATAARMPVDVDYTIALALGDVDADGDLDLVCGNSSRYGGQQNRLYLNDGRGFFTDATAAGMPPDGDITFSLALWDVDGDGDADLVCGNGASQQNRLYLNDGRGFFTDVTAARMPADLDETGALALWDVDGDGDVDLVCGNGASQQNCLYLNDGKGFFTDATATRMPVGSGGASALALGDVDGDGDADLVCGNWYQNNLFLNDGKGSFTDATATRMPVGSGVASALALGDVDGDGDLDLFCETRLYLNDGKGFFTDATAARMPVGSGVASALALGDVDGDGDLDLFCETRLYLNGGKGFFTDATVARMPDDSGGASALALGDVDGDGDPDLVCGTVGNPYSPGLPGQQNRLYLNDGKGFFTDATAARMPVDSDATSALMLGDVDGDGDADLVCGNALACHPLTRVCSSGQTRLYLNDGGGVFADATAARMPVDWESTHALALGDVDGDGDADLVCGNGRWWSPSGGRQNRLYLNDGTGFFTDATATRMLVDNERTSALALGDVDGDGDADLVCGNNSQQRLYLNLLRQLDAPHLAILGRAYRLDLYARPANASSFHVGIPFLADAERRTPLPPLGVLGLDPMRIVTLPIVLVSPTTGIATSVLHVPGDPSLVGVRVYTQALLLPDLAWSMQSWRLTNVNADTVLRL